MSKSKQTTLLSIEVVGARQRLKGFVNKQYGSDAVADQFIRGIAEVLIDNGLNKRIPTGFQLQWVELAIVGHKLAHLRKQLQPDATTISSVLDRLSLRHYFIFGKKGGKHPLMMPNMLQLLPQASKPVKKLLPDLTWVKQQVPNASSLVPSASTTAESSLQSVASTSNHLTAGHVWQLDGSSSLSSTMSATDRTAASVPPEVCEAQHCLKVAVKVQHSGSTVTELFICGIADALIEHGLSKRSPTGFRMQWVSFDTIGHQLATLKKQTQRKEPLRKIMEQLPLQRYFTWTQSASSERFLTAIFPELLPHADSAVQALLPDVQWHAVPAQIVPPTVGFADTVICDSLQSAAACSSQLTAAQITAYASIAQPSVQPHVQEGRKHALPLAAIVVDLGLRCATADTRRLYIVQTTEGRAYLNSTVAFGVSSQEHVIANVQKHLDAAGVAVMWNCQTLANALPEHAKFVPQQIFDIQVAEAVLAHIQNFPDSSYCHNQHTLQELLAMYDLQQQPSRKPGDSPIAEGTQLLTLATKQMQHLGQTGLGLVLNMSQAWYRSAIQDPATGTARTYSKQAQTPINTDLLMSFADDYKPSFERLTSPAAQKPLQDAAQGQSIEDKYTSDLMGDEVRSMLLFLPTEVRDAIILYFCGLDPPSDDAEHHGKQARMLIEIVADTQREVLLRFSNREVVQLPVSMNLPHAVQLLAGLAGLDGPDPFRSDNRMGVEGTLHRISAMRDRHGSVSGLTYRIGRHVQGAGGLLLDVLSKLNCVDAGSAGASSLLLLGPPGVGKTTLLRDVVRLLANDFNKRVIVVDTSNEIGGDGAVPHTCLGKARRMSPTDRDQQHKVLLEAVQNHTPEVIVVDEIGGSKEVNAVKTIAQRGVVMMATAHGVSLENLIKNPDLNTLVGGVCQVTIGDAAAKGSNKIRTERRGAPVFSCLVEVLSHDTLRLHSNVAASVDALLAGKQPATQLRKHRDGTFIVRFETPEVGTKGKGGRPVVPASWLASLAKMAQQSADPMSWVY